MPGPTTTSNSVLATWTSKAFYIPLSWVQEASHLFGHPSKIRSFILLTHTHTRIKKTSTSHGRLHLFRSIQSFRPTSPTVQEPPLELFDARLSCPRHVDGDEMSGVFWESDRVARPTKVRICKDSIFALPLCKTSYL